MTSPRPGQRGRVLQSPPARPSVEELEDLRRLLLVDDADGEADVDEHVVADLRLGHVGEADLLDDAAEAHPAHRHAAAGSSVDLQRSCPGLPDTSFASLPTLAALRRAATATCPRLMPPSFGGTCAVQQHPKPGLLQRGRRPLGEQPVLEAAAGERHALLAHQRAPRDDRRRPSALWNRAAMRSPGRRGAGPPRPRSSSGSQSSTSAAPPSRPARAGATCDATG